MFLDFLLEPLDYWKKEKWMTRFLVIHIATWILFIEFVWTTFDVYFFNFHSFLEFFQINYWESFVVKNFFFFFKFFFFFFTDIYYKLGIKGWFDFFSWPCSDLWSRFVLFILVFFFFLLFIYIYLWRKIKKNKLYGWFPFFNESIEASDNKLVKVGGNDQNLVWQFLLWVFFFFFIFEWNSFNFLYFDTFEIANLSKYKEYLIFSESQESKLPSISVRLNPSLKRWYNFDRIVLSYSTFFDFNWSYLNFFFINSVDSSIFSSYCYTLFDSYFKFDYMNLWKLWFQIHNEVGIYFIDELDIKPVLEIGKNKKDLNEVPFGGNISTVATKRWKLYTEYRWLYWQDDLKNVLKIETNFFDSYKWKNSPEFFNLDDFSYIESNYYDNDFVLGWRKDLSSTLLCEIYDVDSSLKSSILPHSAWRQQNIMGVFRETMQAKFPNSFDVAERIKKLKHQQDDVRSSSRLVNFSSSVENFDGVKNIGSNKINPGRASARLFAKQFLLDMYQDIYGRGYGNYCFQLPGWWKTNWFNLYIAPLSQGPGLNTSEIVEKNVDNIKYNLRHNIVDIFYNANTKLKGNNFNFYAEGGKKRSLLNFLNNLLYSNEFITSRSDFKLGRFASRNFFLRFKEVYPELFAFAKSTFYDVLIDSYKQLYWRYQKEIDFNCSLGLSCEKEKEDFVNFQKTFINNYFRVYEPFDYSLLNTSLLNDPYLSRDPSVCLFRYYSFGFIQFPSNFYLFLMHDGLNSLGEPSIGHATNSLINLDLYNSSWVRLASEMGIHLGYFGYLSSSHYSLSEHKLDISFWKNYFDKYLATGFNSSSFLLNLKLQSDSYFSDSSNFIFFNRSFSLRYMDRVLRTVYNYKSSILMHHEQLLNKEVNFWGNSSLFNLMSTNSCGLFSESGFLKIDFLVKDSLKYNCLTDAGMHLQTLVYKFIIEHGLTFQAYNVLAKYRFFDILSNDIFKHFALPFVNFYTDLFYNGYRNYWDSTFGSWLFLLNSDQFSFFSHYDVHTFLPNIIQEYPYIFRDSKRYYWKFYDFDVSETYAERRVRSLNFLQNFPYYLVFNDYLNYYSFEKWIGASGINYKAAGILSQYWFYNNNFFFNFSVDNNFFFVYSSKEVQIARYYIFYEYPPFKNRM